MISGRNIKLKLRFRPRFRSNTSILAQKKKNQKKKASHKRALDRRHSEGSESEKHDDFDKKVKSDRFGSKPKSRQWPFTSIYIAFVFFYENQDDVGSYEGVSHNNKPQKRDSGIDLSEKSNVKIKNRKSNSEQPMINGTDINFKSGMIFDLEM